MKKLALKIEHSFQNRVVGHHLLESSTATVGQNRGAHIRLLGEDISELHAAFDLRDDHWVLCDLGSDAGTYVAQKPIVELKLEGPTVIHIGRHQLKATPERLERDLFQRADIDAGQGAELFHQVVILRQGRLSQSLLLKPTESFVNVATGSLAAPSGAAWIVTEVGDLTFKQRLVRADILREDLRPDAETKRAGGVMLALFVLAVTAGGFLFLGPSAPETAPPDNQFTRMIFDGKRPKPPKKVAASSARPANENPAAAGGQAKAQAAHHSSAPTPRVVLNLQNSGLGALIGKVAARAGKTAKLVESAGVAAGTGTSGRALGLGGGSALDKLGAGVGTGTTLKVGGLGTVGKGGGKSGYQGSGALKDGVIGNAEVGVLEEESQIDGGLDKEAIARVIRSQLGQIRYCYERQLSASPDLYGKILVKFTIGSAGSVVAQAVGTTSLNNAMVEGCILRRVAGWQFPTPKGGTNVLVTYPFLFKSTK